MSWKKALVRTAKNAAIGGSAGYITGHLVSDAGAAEAGGKSGLRAGVAVGLFSSLPFGKLAKAAHSASKVYARGLQATPGSKVGSTLTKVNRAVTRGKVVYRKIRGRIVPIRVK
jgi:hypothetical protein